MAPKRFDELIRVMAEVREHQPGAQLVIVGDGYERLALEQQISDLDAADWIRLAGHVSDEELLALYRQAWLVASASIAEGWGMTLTEAAACGTPGGGHPHQRPHRLGARRDERAAGRRLAGAGRARSSQVLADDDLRLRLSEGARKYAADAHLGRHRRRRAGPAGRRGPPAQACAAANTALVTTDAPAELAAAPRAWAAGG